VCACLRALPHYYHFIISGFRHFQTGLNLSKSSLFSLSFSKREALRKGTGRSMYTSQIGGRFILMNGPSLYLSETGTWRIVIKERALQNKRVRTAVNSFTLNFRPNLRCTVKKHV
jgi:hypothetical protein